MPNNIIYVITDFYLKKIFYKFNTMLSFNWPL